MQNDTWQITKITVNSATASTFATSFGFCLTNQVPEGTSGYIECPKVYLGNCRVDARLPANAV